MKLSTRIIAILLLVPLCFSMVACSGSRDNIFGVTTPTTPLGTATTGDSVQIDPEATTGYRNDFFQFSCVLHYEWYVFNDDEMSQMLGTASAASNEGTAGDAHQKPFNNGETQVDFYAVSLVLGQMINIVLSKEKLQERLLTDEQLLKASVSRFSSELANVSDTIATHDIKNIPFLGKERPALVFQVDFQGAPFQETIFVIRKNGYLATITITDMTGSPTTDYVDYFQQID